MSLWIRPADSLPRFVDECLSDFRQMERRMRQVERAIFEPLRHCIPSEVLHQSISEIVDNESKFAVSLDVSKFKPEILKVNVDGHRLRIEEKEELKEDNG
ncbi:hypothetical protein KIN20_018803 [Parelaphostrongylus tenuis]|uniref:SHSP domain-containing protein n=1 Tax=Parelaphostrongylus tenuis TaxID=148309 RepID=A0AAD5QRU9_PARTN|nr:hypothetical protein KIN20_018803 [Parelaphostrongylus tenuis]